jgi:hypothetical protein
MFRVFPFISLFVWFLTKNEVNYDIFWAPVTAAFVVYKIVHSRIRLNKLYASLLLLLIFLLLLKYIFPWFVSDGLSLKAALMDGKWVVYLTLVTLWVGTFGVPSIDNMYKAAVFFSIIYCFKALLMFLSGHIDRSGLLLEANYDGYMILMAYCFRNQVKTKGKWDDKILVFTTLLTLSRTGIASLFAIWIYRTMRKNLLLLIPLIPILLAIVLIGFSLRGAQSAEHLDRFMYWEQAFLLFYDSDPIHLLCGFTPGKALDMIVLPEFQWTIDMFDEARGVDGIFPFMFHSVYLRIAITWGIPMAIIYTLVLLVKFFRTKIVPLRELCMITLIQGFSLSTLTLPNVSILLFFCFFMTKKVAAYEKNKTPRKNHKYRLAISK